MHRGLFITLAGGLLLGLGHGCGPRLCLQDGTNILDVGIFDAQSGARLCFADVRAHSGATEFRLKSWASSDPDLCGYFAAGRPGTYRVEVSMAGYVPQAIDGIKVEWEDEECGIVATQTRDVRLEPDANSPRSTDAGPD